MEKIKFTIQILVLVLALPVWFFAEMKMADKAVKNSRRGNNDSLPVKKEMTYKVDVPAVDFNGTTASFAELMVVSY